MPNKTFAFSNKFNKWATRYSFTPSWYGSADKHLLSSKANTGSVWRHDVNDTRCSFYDTDYKSKLVVASNQDPSAVKVFNALSLETNSDKWAANIKTNEERDVQGGSISNPDWKEKEGFLYANMPKSTTHSTGPISYAGIDPRSYEEATEGLSDADQWPLVSGTWEDLYGTTDPFTVDVKINRSEAPLATGDGCKLIFLNAANDLFEEQLVYVDGTGIHPNLSDVDVDVALGILNDLELVGVYGDVLRIKHKNIGGIEWEEHPGGSGNPLTLPNVLLFAIRIILTMCRYPIYVISPTNINGDSLRGPYAKMELSFNESVPMQVSAVNVDYQFSKLDARLTQNT